MVLETHQPMQCPNCGENVNRIQIDDEYGRIDCIVDPEPIASANIGLTYQEHECSGGIREREHQIP